MGSSSSSGFTNPMSSMGAMGGKWTKCLHFWNGNKWVQVSNDNLIVFFERELQAKEEIIHSSEIRKYELWWKPDWVANLHEYTVVKTTNWWWSIEKMSEGIFMQRFESEQHACCYFAGKPRPFDNGQAGKCAFASNKETIMDVAKWIINRNELGNTYHLFTQNCHSFASLLHEAIIRTELSTTNPRTCASLNQHIF